jgi:kynurenine formamidase
VTPKTADMQMIDSIGEWLGRSDVVRLGHELKIGVPRYSSHPPFMYSLTNMHGDGLVMVQGQDPRTEGASDVITMGVHTGTHQDSLAHAAWDGKLHDGTPFNDPGVMEYSSGVHMKTRRDNIDAVVAPGILLDFPAFLGVKGAIPVDYQITPETMAACADKFGLTFNKGDVVLIRTGWDTKYTSAREFLAAGSPGPTIEAARMLIEAGMVASGSDTMPYEAIPAVVPLEVHVEMLVKAGVFIFETMDLRGLSERKAYRFLFVSAPLRIFGQTGSPVCPVAVVPKS